MASSSIATLDPTASESLSALSKVLSCYGHATSRQRLLEACRGTVSPESIVGSLHDHGLSARLVRLEASELELLPMPALIVTSSGAVVLSEIDASCATLWRGDMPVRVKRIELSAMHTGLAIEVRPRLPMLRGFVGTLAALLSTLRAALVRLALMAGFLAGLGALGPVLLSVTLDRAAPERATHLLAVLALATTLLSVQRAWITWLRERIAHYIDAQLQSGTAREVFRHALGLPLEQLTQHSVGSMLQTLASTGAVSGLVTRIAVVWLLDMIMAFVYCGLIAIKLPAAAGLLLLFGLATLGVAVLLARKSAALQKTELDRASSQRSMLYELIAGVPTLKSAGAESVGLQRWIGALLSERMLTYRRERTVALLGLFLEMSQQLMVVTVLAWGAVAALDGELSVGVLLAGLLYADTFAQSLGRFAGGLVPLWTARADVERIDALLDQDVEERRPRQRIGAGTTTEAAIVLDDVWFRYGVDQPWVLGGHTQRFPVGEISYIRGASGAGKSTLLRIIAGLYFPERGTVSVLGRPPAIARSAVAYVPQDTYLFEGTILDNLKILSGAEQFAIERAAVATGLSKWIATLPMGYRTPLPPGGRTLSGGQRQLIVLTAVVASDKPVVLLDEALSQIDRLTRVNLMNGTLFRGKTVLAVAHD